MIMIGCDFSDAIIGRSSTYPKVDFEAVGACEVLEMELNTLQRASLQTSMGCDD